MGASNIGDSEFDSLILKQRKTAAVVFWAGWNNISRQFMPTFDAVANENSHLLAFYRADVDATAAVVAKYGISSVPVTLLFKNGVLAGQLIGAVTKSQLSSFVSNV